MKAMVVIFLLLMLGGISAAVHFSTMTTVAGYTVVHKERVLSGTGTSQTSEYMIFTDKETFKNVDSYFALKFNSSDLYGKLGIGATCTFTVTGFRVPLFSMYRNILSAAC